MSDTNALGFSTGQEAFVADIVVAGANQAGAAFKLRLGRASTIYIGASSRSIVAGDLWGPILTFENPASVALTLPLLATMGVIASGTGQQMPFLRYRVLGAGAGAINPVSGTGAAGARILWNGLDPAGMVPQTGETWTMGPVCRLDYVGKEPVTGNETWVASLG